LTKYEQEFAISQISGYLDEIIRSVEEGRDDRVITYYRNRIMKEVSRAVSSASN